LTKRDRTDLGRPRQIILSPIEQGSGGTALGWSHRDCIAWQSFSVNYILLQLAKLLSAGSVVSGWPVLERLAEAVGAYIVGFFVVPALGDLLQKPLPGSRRTYT
jgi:hypothetical protein